MLQTAQYISYGLGVYILIGILFSLYFITRGIRNESIGGKGIILRLLLTPEPRCYGRYYWGQNHEARPP